jgi:glycosyltransferase involved in cell wall biosynthesis
VPQLASALATLLGDPELRKKMGAHGRGRVEREYQFAQFAKALKRILKEQCVS